MAKSKRIVHLAITPECLRRLQDAGQETIEDDDTIVHIHWTGEKPAGARGGGTYLLPEVPRA